MFCDAVACFPCACKIAEFKTELRQCRRADFLSPGGREVSKYPPVLAKYVVNIAHMHVVDAILFVMPRRATLIVAEFFVGAPCNALTAFGAKSIGFYGDHGNEYTSVRCAANRSIRKTVHVIC